MHMHPQINYFDFDLPTVVILKNLLSQKSKILVRHCLHIGMDPGILERKGSVMKLSKEGPLLEVCATKDEFLVFFKNICKKCQWKEWPLTSFLQLLAPVTIFI